MGEKSLLSPRSRVRRSSPVFLAVASVLLLLLLIPFVSVIFQFKGGWGGTVESSWRPIPSVYATIWTHELRALFGVGSQRSAEAEAAAAAQGHNFTEVVGMLKAKGFDLLMSSVSWNDTETTDGQLHLEGLTHVADVVCKIHNLRLSIVVDVGLPPYWLYMSYPDAQTKDSGDQRYKYIAIGHGLAVRRSYIFIGSIADHLKAIAPAGCIHSIQPNWNNEYEAKFTQEYDRFQDYSEFCETQYTTYFGLINGALPFWNARWNTTFKSWSEVKQPKYHQGNRPPDATALYHDYLRFRDQLGSKVVLEACALLHTKGIPCLLHIPEIYSVTDPIYQGSMFWSFAKSPYVKYLVMDSNFMTAYGRENNPVIGQFLVSIAKAYPDKFVYLEATFERFGNDTAGWLRKGLDAGVDGLGCINWYTRVSKNVLNPPKAADGGPLMTCQAAVTTAVVAPHELAMCIRGLDNTGQHKNPVQEYILGAFARHAGGCGKGVHVFGDMAHMEARASEYKAFVNVESTVLYTSTQQRLERILAAARKSGAAMKEEAVPDYLRHANLPSIPTVVDDTPWAEPAGASKSL